MKILILTDREVVETLDALLRLRMDLSLNVPALKKMEDALAATIRDGGDQ